MTFSDIIDRITLADDTVNAIDRCNLTATREMLAGFTNGIYGWFGGGFGPSITSDIVDRITLANDVVNAIDRCNLTGGREMLAGFTG